MNATMDLGLLALTGGRLPSHDVIGAMTSPPMSLASKIGWGIAVGAAVLAIGITASTRRSPDERKERLAKRLGALDAEAAILEEAGNKEEAAGLRRLAIVVKQRAEAATTALDAGVPTATDVERLEKDALELEAEGAYDERSANALYEEVRDAQEKHRAMKAKIAGYRATAAELRKDFARTGDAQWYEREASQLETQMHLEFETHAAERRGLAATHEKRRLEREAHLEEAKAAEIEKQRDVVEETRAKAKALRAEGKVTEADKLDYRATTAELRIEKKLGRTGAEAAEKMTLADQQIIEAFALAEASATRAEQIGHDRMVTQRKIDAAIDAAERLEAQGLHEGAARKRGEAEAMAVEIDQAVRIPIPREWPDAVDPTRPALMTDLEAENYLRRQSQMLTKQALDTARARYGDLMRRTAQQLGATESEAEAAVDRAFSEMVIHDPAGRHAQAYAKAREDLLSKGRVKGFLSRVVRVEAKDTLFGDKSKQSEEYWHTKSKSPVGVTQEPTVMGEEGEMTAEPKACELFDPYATAKDPRATAQAMVSLGPERALEAAEEDEDLRGLAAAGADIGPLIEAREEARKSRVAEALVELGLTQDEIAVQVILSTPVLDEDGNPVIKPDGAVQHPTLEDVAMMLSEPVFDPEGNPVIDPNGEIVWAHRVWPKTVSKFNVSGIKKLLGQMPLALGGRGGGATVTEEASAAAQALLSLEIEPGDPLARFLEKMRNQPEIRAGLLKRAVKQTEEWKREVGLLQRQVHCPPEIRRRKREFGFGERQADPEEFRERIESAETHMLRRLGKKGFLDPRLTEQMVGILRAAIPAETKIDEVQRVADIARETVKGQFASKAITKAEAAAQVQRILAAQLEAVTAIERAHSVAGEKHPIARLKELGIILDPRVTAVRQTAALKRDDAKQRASSKRDLAKRLERISSEEMNAIQIITGAPMEAQIAMLRENANSARDEVRQEATRVMEEARSQIHGPARIAAMAARAAEIGADAKRAAEAQQIQALARSMQEADLLAAQRIEAAKVEAQQKLDDILVKETEAVAQAQQPRPTTEFIRPPLAGADIGHYRDPIAGLAHPEELGFEPVKPGTTARRERQVFPECGPDELALLAERREAHERASGLANQARLYDRRERHEDQALIQRADLYETWAAESNLPMAERTTLDPHYVDSNGNPMLRLPTEALYKQLEEKALLEARILLREARAIEDTDPDQAAARRDLARYLRIAAGILPPDPASADPRTQRQAPMLLRWAAERALGEASEIQNATPVPDVVVQGAAALAEALDEKYEAAIQGIEAKTRGVRAKTRVESRKWVEGAEDIKEALAEVSLERLLRTAPATTEEVRLWHEHQEHMKDIARQAKELPEELTAALAETQQPKPRPTVSQVSGRVTGRGQEPPMTEEEREEAKAAAKKKRAERAKRLGKGE